MTWGKSWLTPELAELAKLSPAQRTAKLRRSAERSLSGARAVVVDESAYLPASATAHLRLPPRESHLDHDPGMPPIGRATIRPPRYRNAGEARYGAHLDDQRRAGHVLWHGYECIRLRLDWGLDGDDDEERKPGCWWLPDWLVVPSSGLLEVHEFKGHMREAARVRIRTAASRFPFRVYIIREEKGGIWEKELVS